MVEGEFTTLRADHLLRQAAFKSLREDKPASEVSLERAPLKRGLQSKHSADAGNLESLELKGTVAAAFMCECPLP